ncbi:MAG: NAD-glutamate dehydrogenase [Xanthomonadales bacterium]|nr:NAD-glutamate dehydrogenase [Xanthomonadales bacterium]
MEAVAEKSVVLDSIVERVREGVPASKAEKLELFGRHYLRRVPDDELGRRSEEAWAAIIRGEFELVGQRMRGETGIRVFNPTSESHGWESSHTVVEIVTRDMPFLVDSTTMAISEMNISIHLIVHPVFRIVRDAGGYLMDIATLEQELADSTAESIMHFEIDRQTDPEMLQTLERRIKRFLNDVSLAVRDWRPMADRVERAWVRLSESQTPYAEDRVQETIEFLRWLADDHFTFLGYREYRIEHGKKGAMLCSVPDTGMGILREDDEAPEHTSTQLVETEPEAIAESGPMIVTKTNSKSTVHRSAYMDYIGVMTFDEEGQLIGEERFLGLYTSAAYNRRPWNIPYVRHKVQAVMRASGFAAESHGGKALLHIMETLPRDELFQASPSELFELVIGVYDLQERQKTRLFIRADRFQRFFSCLVYIPRDRFTTETRERIQGILKRKLKGERVDFTVQVSESKLARLHVIIHVKPEQEIEYDVNEIEGRLVEAVRSWHDRLAEILVEKHGEDVGVLWAKRFGKAFPIAYMEDVTPWVASFDVENLSRLAKVDDLRMSMYRPRKRGEGLIRFKTFRCNTPIPLSDVLPMLENMGLRIVSERPYRLVLDDGSVRWIQDFDMSLASGQTIDLDLVKEDFQEAFDRVARGRMESDGFNRLILEALLNWRQITVIRSYCKYLLQTGVPFSQAYMEETLAQHPGIVRLVIELFEAKFDPERDDEAKSNRDQRLRALRVSLERAWRDREVDAVVSEALQRLIAAGAEARQAQVEAVCELLRLLVERVQSLDEDRILRAFIDAIRATLRTNAFQVGPDGEFATYVSLKFNSRQVPDLPKPRPWREIFVYSPRVEGIHLRGGRVARGGLRWSDRREDFRTEVLGLMKAQMVKNTMIVPVGAKGGFVVKRPPETGGRDALMAEVVACYRAFICGLLEITDNLKNDEVVHPPEVVRHDKDDTYLVVAADKGTATFSDIANSVAESHDFWLGDAFASGGSAGYDHKKMGITARGAWESVKRHFREMGMDCQARDFTVVGIGDMSGDVFGNGMLLSPHIRLQAAFNHLHIFLDPNPDPAASLQERERLFALERSAWTDYNPELISQGGGVYSRRDKTIPISDEVKAWLGISADQLTPNELIKALLKAPVDLLWNGGIGTYVKSTAETHGDVGDRANEAVRVDGKELRCRVVGEGGNLGLTQKGRIEFAQNGGRINTDFVDNSAGVDCSDHEVNIKILLNKAMAEGLLGLEDRNSLLSEMTDEVSELVLRDNYLQTQAISMMAALTVERLGSKAHFIDVLESQGILDRELENLPSRDELNERKKRGQGLTRPELAVLLSYSKITLYQDLLRSDVPEDPFLSRELVRYFPQPLQEGYADFMQSHRLRREIIATVITNSMVNRMGATFALRMQEDTGASSSQIAKAYTAAREIFSARQWWDAIEAHDNQVPSDNQMMAHLTVWNLLRHVTRWLLNHNRGNLEINELVERYQTGAEIMVASVRELAAPRVRRDIDQRITALESVGFDSLLAEEIAGVPALNPTLDIIDVAVERDRPVEHVGGIYYQLDRSMRLSWLMNQIENLAVEGQWHAHARGGLRDELYGHHRALARQVLAAEDNGQDPTESVARWMEEHQAQIEKFSSMMADMRSAGSMDYATVSVAVRALEHLVLSFA